MSPSSDSGEADRSRTVHHSIDQLSLLHPRDLHSLLDSTDESRSVHDFPAHIQTSSGEVRQCLLAVEAIEFSGESSVILAVRDVTEQIELEGVPRLTDRATRGEERRAGEVLLHSVARPEEPAHHHPWIPRVSRGGYRKGESRSSSRRSQTDQGRDHSHATPARRTARAFAGRPDRERSRALSLSDLLREALELLQGRTDKRNISVEIDRPDEMPAIFGDPVRILEVFQNLLENAIKFMGDEPHPTIRVTWENMAGDDLVRVRIQDNGIGIDPRFHKKIFGLFEQLHPDGSGTGIGLALVRRIVELHGGEIRVESEGAGRGSAFTLTLPLAPDAATARRGRGEPQTKSAAENPDDRGQPRSRRTDPQNSRER